jgi:anti-sigma factor RsiW
MTCDDVRRVLDQHVEGGGTGATRAAVESHLASCAECRADLGALVFLRPLAAALPRTIEPRADLWPGIQGRLAPRGKQPAGRWWIGRRPALLAAAAVLLVALSSGITALLLRDRPPPPAAVMAARPAGGEQQYLRAAAELDEALRAGEPQLAPETVATLRRNLAVIDSAIVESRAALARDPANAALAELLWTSHRQKLSLLQQAARVPRRS